MVEAATARLGEIRSDWQVDEIEALFALPFNDLVFHAQRVHRRHFDPNAVQVSTLLSIKTGACPEDCAYCPQSTRYDTGLEAEKLMDVEQVLEQARAAAASSRVCSTSCCARRSRLSSKSLISLSLSRRKKRV